MASSVGTAVKIFPGQPGPLSVEAWFAWLVLRDALVMIAGGTAIALPCVWVWGRLVESQLYDVKPTDPVPILASTLVLCSAALGAALIPAHRAAAVNPTDALRFE